MATNLVISLLGSSGGVAKALLALLNHSCQHASAPLHSLLQNSQIHLIDIRQKPLNHYRTRYPSLADKLAVHSFDLADTDRFKEHLLHTRTNLVIDVSWADTVGMLECCNEFGISYINSALENTWVDETEAVERFTLLERYRIVDEARDKYTNMKGILCSGMNPGVVQWMAIEMINRYPDERPLACYIVEQDTSFYRDPSVIQANTVYSSWSPECFLDEAILNYPVFMKWRSPFVIFREVYELEFKVTLGDKSFYGCLMPHEEVVTLGKLYDMEVGFLYRVSEYMTDIIRTNLDNVDDLWDWHHRVLDPEEAELLGEDLVGVLLVYEDKERYMYNVLDNRSIFRKFGISATYFQVACGLYAAASAAMLDSLPSGVHYVDELLLASASRYGSYVSYYMKHFVTGENHSSDGLLSDRIKEIPTE